MLLKTILPFDVFNLYIINLKSNKDIKSKPIKTTNKVFVSNNNIQYYINSTHSADCLYLFSQRDP